MTIRRYESKNTKILPNNSLRGTGTEVFKSTRPVKIESAQDDVILIANEGDRLDILASRFYGSPRLWFVIASVNNLTNGSMHIKPGTSIRIPAKNRVV